MKVLIIGGTRFVGYQLAWRLIAGGHRVTLLNRGSTPDPFGPRVDRLVADRATAAFARVLAGREFDAAVDLACYTGEDAAGAVATLGGRVGHYVMISTGQVYLVRAGAPRPAREVDYAGPTIPEPLDPADREDWVYGIEKRRAEDVLADAGREGGFPATRLRIPMVVGERDYYRRTEAYLVRLLDGGPVLVPDGGLHPTRHVYGGAVVRLIAAILGDARTFGRAYNLAQAETPTLVELLSLMAALLGAPARLVPAPAADLRSAGLTPLGVSPFSGRWMSFLDPGLAQAELGFAHEAPAIYLDKIITAYLNHPPAAPPPGYATRAAEVRLARELLAGPDPDRPPGSGGR